MGKYLALFIFSYFLCPERSWTRVVDHLERLSSSQATGLELVESIDVLSSRLNDNEAVRDSFYRLLGHPDNLVRDRALASLGAGLERADSNIYIFEIGRYYRYDARASSPYREGQRFQNGLDENLIRFFKNIINSETATDITRSGAIVNLAGHVSRDTELRNLLVGLASIPGRGESHVMESTLDALALLIGEDEEVAEIFFNNLNNDSLRSQATRHLLRHAYGNEGVMSRLVDYGLGHSNIEANLIIERLSGEISADPVLIERIITRLERNRLGRGGINVAEVKLLAPFYDEGPRIRALFFEILSSSSNFSDRFLLKYLIEFYSNQVVTNLDVQSVMIRHTGSPYHDISNALVALCQRGQCSND